MIDFLVLEIILPILNFFYDLTHNYGWAIIYLTVSIKLLLMPLTIKQFKSMLEMQKVQPKLQEIQQKYRDRPEELNKKIMEFYKEHKINPFGGCLPLLLQMPVLIALYTALYIPEKYNIKFTPENSSLFGIQNMKTMGISHFDTTTNTSVFHWDNIILVILFGITTFISQKMMTKSNDPMQRQMLYTMPLIITLTFVIFPVPSGVLLYLVVSNLITIGQNLVLMNENLLNLRNVQIVDNVQNQDKLVKEGENNGKKDVNQNINKILKSEEETQKFKKKRFSSLNSSGITVNTKPIRYKKKKWN